jgi:hypothetical protein
LSLIGLSFSSLNGLIGFIGLDSLVSPVGIVLGYISLVEIVKFISLISLDGDIGRNSLIRDVIVFSLGLVAVSLGNVCIKFETKTKLSPCYLFVRESWLWCVRRVFSSLAGLGSVFGNALHNATQLFFNRIPQMTKYFVRCENIPTWISLCVTTVFSQQGGISIFKFPKRFLDISWAETSLYSLY